MMSAMKPNKTQEAIDQAHPFDKLRMKTCCCLVSPGGNTGPTRARIATTSFNPFAVGIFNNPNILIRLI